MNSQRLFKIIFICLVIASIASAETSDEPNSKNISSKSVPSSTLEQIQNETNNPNSSDVCDINVQGMNEIQRLTKIHVKKWRTLKQGMTLSDVKKLLGDPKLSQASSHECFLFYQETPFFNAKPNFSYRTSSKQIIDKDRYGNITDKIGINDVGGVRNGVLVFEAKTINEFIAELHDECQQKVKKFTELFDKHDNTKSDFRVQKHVSGMSGSSLEARDAERANRLADAEDARKAADRKAAENYRSNEIDKIKNEYEGKIAVLKEDCNPRTPIYILKYFNQPDWNNMKMLLGKNITIGNSNRLKEKQQVQINWKKLQLNMTQQQVEKLLGQSTRFESNVQGTKLFYGSEAQCGELFLSPRSDSTERLTSWTEPFWGKKSYLQFYCHKEYNSLKAKFFNTFHQR